MNPTPAAPFAPALPLEQLLAIVAKLRDPQGGCPWDLEQTHESLRGCLLEEAHEVVEAIERHDDAHLREELGDLLLQVVMHSQMASETGRFDFNAVAAEIGEKLVRRHPHVFGESTAADTDAVLKRWDEIKRQEKAQKGETPVSLLDGVSSAMPALVRAEKIGKRAARVGFDWETPGQVIAKLREELEEIEQALAHGDAGLVEEEIGDLLFAAAQLARKAKVEPEVALSRATRKFIDRFQRLEKAFRDENRRIESATAAELDRVWNQIKAEERGGSSPLGDGSSGGAA
jgi:MazG family protein